MKLIKKRFSCPSTIILLRDTQKYFVIQIIANQRLGYHLIRRHYICCVWIMILFDTNGIQLQNPWRADWITRLPGLEQLGVRNYINHIVS